MVRYPSDAAVACPPPTRGAPGRIFAVLIIAEGAIHRAVVEISWRRFPHGSGRWSTAASCTVATLTLLGASVVGAHHRRGAATRRPSSSPRRVGELHDRGSVRRPIPIGGPPWASTGRTGPPRTATPRAPTWTGIGCAATNRHRSRGWRLTGTPPPRSESSCSSAHAPLIGICAKSSRSVVSLPAAASRRTACGRPGWSRFGVVTRGPGLNLRRVARTGQRRAAPGNVRRSRSGGA